MTLRAEVALDHPFGNEPGAGNALHLFVIAETPADLKAMQEIASTLRSRPGQTPEGLARDDGAVCIQRNRDIATQLAAEIDKHAICRSDADCEAVPVGACPLACWVAVAKQNDQKVKPLIAESVQRLDPACVCMYRCQAAPVHASCSRKKCMIAKAR